MSSYNKVILMGNLTRDPEVKSLPSGNSVANVSMAINRRFTSANGEKREEVTYVEVAFWGKQAELFTRLNIRKGTPLFVDGRLQLDTWDDKATGQKRSKLRVVGENFQLIGGRREDGGGSGTTNPRGGASASSAPERESGGYYPSEGDEPF